jgi:hypothetical protein
MIKKRFSFVIFILFFTTNAICYPVLQEDLTLKYGSYFQSPLAYVAKDPNSCYDLLGKIIPCPTVELTVYRETDFSNTANPSGERIYPIWNRFNIWDPSRAPNGKESPGYDFLEEAILMTSTGGRQGYDEMYNSLGIGIHDFSRLDSAIDRLVPFGITPTIVIGNVPSVISNRPTDFGRYFDANLGAPVDENAWGLYHDYIQALFLHLQTRYGSATIPPSAWEYRLMTEPDNVDWFDPYNMGENENGNPYNLVKYMRLYDETIDAIQTGLGNNGIALNPGNMMITPYLQPENSSWIPDIAYMLNHDGNPVTRFCVSLYGNIAGDGTFHSSGVQLDADPRELKLFIDSIRNLLSAG